MKIIGKSPSDAELRDSLGLPDNAQFRGWAVHTPHEDGFLAALDEGEASDMLAFSGNPENALLFRTADEAVQIAVDLAYAAVVVAIFDVGSQLAVVRVGGNKYSEFGNGLNS